MKTAVHIARILLGLIFLVFGLNGFYTFIPVPEYHPFMALLVSSGLIFFVKAIEVTAGLLLLLNRFVLAALVLLGPVVVNIALFHLLIDHRNWPIALVNLLLYGVLVGNYWAYFKVFLKPKVDQL
ncbi:hypothetical protein C8N40_105111 [Pontibacter mucosus]|uniref:DoxX-like protein n=1 Tax=Pontibacter mucosus TaxID=1649266 RepID=A0A2T5YHN9_9BACT|nr:hypothetical protein [Pontibacter mucosus]PTX18822.1 hypothetical protein C8N40_105111 [Pontibacter mucosus]